jgi:putative transposase
MFGSLLEARIIIEQWRMEYNQRRPHSSLGYLTPTEFARQQKFQSMQTIRHKDNRWALEPIGFN